jgi:hypothetical protein
LLALNPNALCGKPASHPLASASRGTDIISIATTLTSPIEATIAKIANVVVVISIGADYNYNLFIALSFSLHICKDNLKASSTHTSNISLSKVAPELACWVGFTFSIDSVNSISFVTISDNCCNSPRVLMITPLLHPN